MGQTPTLRGRRLTLRALGPDGVTDRYLSWLADPVVNEHSRRRGQPAPTREEAAAYLAAMRPGEAVLAMSCARLGHIGNIKYGPIDRSAGRSDISILIGERTAWGQGYAREAIHLVTRWLFEAEGLAKVDAGSANPAFLKAVRRLGWREAGTRQVRIGHDVVDWTLVELPRASFTSRPDLEAPDGSLGSS